MILTDVTWFESYPRRSSLFPWSGTFVVPAGVTCVRVLAVGGGGGGSCSLAPGGGSGYLKSSVISVSPGTSIPFTVGNGGVGGFAVSCFSPSPNGQDSSFGTLLIAKGGNAGIGVPGPGGNGGSGGGAGGECSFSPHGGENGGNGFACSSQSGGVGQGMWSSYLGLFKEHVFSAGTRGQGGAVAWSNAYAGGGGGGVVYDGGGPFAQNGDEFTYKGFGGWGYGAGGGGGGFSNAHYRGGNGANGLIYVEWGE